MDHPGSEMATIVLSSNWFTGALSSAVFAALTASFAKIGLAGLDSDLATLIRRDIIFGVLGTFVYAIGKWSNRCELSGKTCLILVLSGLATVASWVCYFRGFKRRAALEPTLGDGS
jgi:transporter family protein